MKLKVLLPSSVLVDEQVTKVTAEAANGSFTLLPRHVDFAAGLVPGILSFGTAGGAEEFLAINEGILVKCGEEVLVSTRNAVRSSDLGKLKETVAEQFEVLDEQESRARVALVKLETDFLRRFMELGGRERG